MADQKQSKESSRIGPFRFLGAAFNAKEAVAKAEAEAATFVVDVARKRAELEQTCAHRAEVSALLTEGRMLVERLSPEQQAPLLERLAGIERRLSRELPTICPSIQLVSEPRKERPENPEKTP